MKILTTSVLIIITLSAAIINSNSGSDPQKIIDKVIDNYGGDLYKSAVIEFEFRDRHYKIFRNKGKILFERFYSDTSGYVHEGFDNKSVFKRINKTEIELADKKSNSIKESINSVIYFFSLPYLLNDRAVVKKYIGEEIIKGKKYYIIEITFRQDGGGTDFEDRYLYWIEQSSFTMDYFAYYFHVNGGGSRFRRVHNVRNVNGIMFGDQENFSSEKINQNLEEFPKLFESGSLNKISDINIKNISVTLLN